MQDAIIMYENGKAIGGEGHPTNASDITFDNTGTDLVSENVEDAIKEVNAKTQHGIVELWANSSPTTAFAGQNIVIGTSYTLDALDIEYGDTSKNVRGVIRCDIGDTAYPSFFAMNGNGDIAYCVRSCAISSITGGYKVVVSDCTYRYRTNAGAITTSTENAEIIPIRITGLIHND